MSIYSEVGRIPAAMSQAAGHDVRRLIAAINERRTEAGSHIIDRGTEAEHGRKR